MSKSKTFVDSKGREIVVTRKEHLTNKIVKTLEIVGESIPYTLVKEYKTLCRIVLKGNTTTKCLTGLYSRVLMLVRNIGASNVRGN